MVTMTLPLDEAAIDKLTAKAQRAGKHIEELVTDLLLGTLDEDERYRAAVRQGLAEANAGQLVDFDRALDRIAAKLNAEPR